MALTVTEIKNAKPRSKPYKLTDYNGLHLLVQVKGRRYRRMNYRHFGKQKTLAFGTWPDVTLADAREKCRAARKLLTKGIDPSDQIKLEKIAASVAAANTFRAIADEWLSKTERDGRSAVTLKKNRWLLNFANQSIGNRPITEITAHELLIVLRKVHSIPLSIQAIEILVQIEHDAALSPYLFPSLRSVDRPMSENTINAALRRMGYAKDEMTGHGFRAMAATLLNEMGIWNADAIERQLAHSDKDSVRSAYTRGEYWEERVRMMQHWSDYLDELRVGAKILTGSFGSR